MTVSEYIFEYLAKRGIDTVYMVSGSSAMWLTDALYRNKDLQAICCHHEQAASMSADGYARVRGIPGACLVTIGPGATNAITGVAQAFLDSSPLIVISGQASSGLVIKQQELGVRQIGTQALNLEPMVSSITKYFKTIIDANEVPQIMEEAYRQSISGRKGPVWIDVPIDVQNKQISDDALNTKITCGASCEDNSVGFREDVDYLYILKCIRNAKKPLILAGGGIVESGCEEDLEQAVTMMQIPVVTSRGGIGAISSDNDWFVGRPGAYGDRPSHFAISQCDLLLILGSRLSVSTTGYYPKRFAGNAIKIWVDIDALELKNDNVPVDYKIQINVSDFLKQMTLLAKDSDIYCDEENNLDEHKRWNEYLQNLKKKYPVVDSTSKNESPLNEYYVTSRISDYCNAESNIIVDTGSVCNIVSQTWFLKKGQRYLISGGLSCMGFWATSIGAFQKNRDVIAIAGDGSAQMNIQELATIHKNKIPLKLFIYNNNGYMLIRHNQHNYMNDRFLGVGPQSGVEIPDFSKIAQAYGIKAFTVNNKDELEETLPIVFQMNEPLVCQIMVKEFAPIVPKIASKVMEDGSLKAAEFEDLFPFLDKLEFEQNLYSN